VLLPEIANGTPIVGSEPACVSAFRDELVGLFPGHERAQRLSSQTRFFTEFVGQNLDRLKAGGDKAPALVQLHCHHHAVLDTRAETDVLDHAEVDYEVLPSGCCGMAGSFGFEAGKYDVSMAAANRVLLPRIRSCDSGTLLIVNGFSCREQIEQGTGRPTLHVAELLARNGRMAA
jgi:Fe-S oxidoreductase